MNIAAAVAMIMPAADLMVLAGEEVADGDDAGHTEVPLIAYVPVQVTPCVVATTDNWQIPLVMAAVELS